jgi:branched-chain amino acid transport system substrate-binding protein
MGIKIEKWRFSLAGLLVLAMVVCPLYFANNAKAAEPQPESFKVGAILTLSGPMAAMGLLEKDGIEIALADLNKNGGVLVQGKKRPIEVIYFDDEASPKKAIDATHSLINKEKVKVIVGLRMNEAIEACQQITEKKKVFVVAAVASYPGVFLGKKYGVLLGDSGWTESVSIVRLLTDKPEKLKKAGIDPAIDKRYDFKNKKVAYYGRDEMYCVYADLGAKAAIEAFGKNQGLKYVGGTMYPIGTTDVTPYVQRMMANKPDIIYVGLYIYEDTLKLCRALKEMGYDFGPNGNLLLVNSNDDFNWGHVIDPLWKEGINLAGSLSTGQDMPLELALKYPKRADFVSKMKAKHNRLPGLLEDNGYDQMLFLAKAVESANTMTDADKIKDAMLKLKVDGVRGPNQVFVTPQTVPSMKKYVNELILPHYARLIVDKNQAKYLGWYYKEDMYWGDGVFGKDLLVK